jgi:hypothetical protein
MKRQLVRACLACAASSAALVGGFAQSATAAVKTTLPGVVYIVKVDVTNATISIPPDKFSKGLKYSRLPRGSTIQYHVINRGTRPYAVRIWDKTTPVIAPGHMAPILVNWNYRGNFYYEKIFHGKPLAPRGRVKVF